MNIETQEKILLHLSKDRIMAKVIAQTDYMPYVKPMQTHLFTDLLGSIISQQLSVKVADTIYKRFLELFENRKPAPQQILDLEEQTLQKVGLSKQKVKYVKNLAEFAIQHHAELAQIEQYQDEEIIELLTQIKGVGRWTVEMILIFSLQRPDVFPIDDLGICQSMIELYEVSEPNVKERRKQLHEIAKVWQPYRTWACRYLWAWRDKKGKAKK
ncbi:MAG: DNA-3-methyladenine glycosylase [Thermoflexibacter sp.]